MENLRKTLGKLRLTEETLISNVIRRNCTVRFMLTLFLVALGISMYFSYQSNSNMIIIFGALILVTWISVIPVLNIRKSSEDKKLLVLQKELNNPRRMYNILKYNSNVNNFDDLENISLNDATKFDHELLENFILEYKLIRQGLFMAITMIVGGITLMSAINLFYNVFLRWVFGALITALVVLMMYFFLKLFNNLPYKIIYRNFDKYSDRCFDVGALSPLHYKMLKLFYNDYANEGQFELSDYKELLRDEVISRKEIVGDYIKDINYIRFTSLLSLGIGVACILQYFNLPTHYSISALCISLILIIFSRVRITDKTVINYEKKLLNDSCKLTSKIMKFLPKEYKEMF